MSNQPSRIKTVDALRGVASVIVCIAHLTNGNKDFLSEGWFKSICAHGWLGVIIFFVISGFILPYSMHRVGYTAKRFGTFLAKRIVRLDPPYLASIIIIILAGYIVSLAPGFKGPQFAPSIPQVLLHFLYVNVFFGYDWLNPVFWTLAIEFQYYIVIGVLFTALSDRRLLIRAISFFLLSALSLTFPEKQFVFHWLPLFMLGVITFHFRISLLTKRGYFIGLLLMFPLAWYVLGLTVASVGLSTALAIAWLDFGGKAFSFFGEISYSLYLLHVPIGMKIINLGSRLSMGMPGKLLIIATAFCVSILSAYALYILVEQPAQRWSSKIKYHSVRAAGTAAIRSA